MGQGVSLTHERFLVGRFSVYNLVEHPDRASSLFLLNLRLPFFLQFAKKWTQALFLGGREVIFLAEVPVL